MNLILDSVNVGFARFPDLAAENVGGKALSTSDEFFAGKENLLKPGRGVFIPEKYTEQGKWMDGWESRRKRVPGHDWCVLQLGMPGVIRGVDIDTNHFTGNYPEFASLEATDHFEGTSTKWVEVVGKQRLRGGSRNLFAVANESRFTHVRLNIFPDGGVARLRVHGEVRPDWEKLAANGEPVDLAALENGGIVLGCNDSFFGPKDNLILPGRAVNMGGGWETQRKRGPGNDWIIVQLARPGRVVKVEVDTNFYKGNYPDRCSLDASMVIGLPNFEDLTRDSRVSWHSILAETKLKPDTRHYFEKEILRAPAVSHVRLNIFPDGGISRLRVFGVLG